MRKTQKKRLFRDSPPPISYWEQARREDNKEKTSTVCKISLTDINVEQQVIRENINDDHVIELSGSMAKHGLLEPIVVEKSEDGYTLIAGFNRIIAAHRLNWEKITAMVREHDENTPIKALALTENIIRRDLTITEECEAVRQLYEEDGLSTSQICSLVGKSRQWVERRLMAPHLQPEVRQALFDGAIGIGIAEMIGGVEDAGARNEILTRAIFSKLNKTEVKALIDVWGPQANVNDAVNQGVETAKELEKAPKNTRTCEACGRTRDYSFLQPVWICKDGCISAQQESNEKGGQGD